MIKFSDSPLRASALLCAAVIPLLAACQGAATPPEARQQAAPVVPEAHIFVDEAMLRRPHAVLGGTVENISGAPLANLSVELELRRRDDGGVELREVPVVPSQLAPGEKGRYRLEVRSEEWSGSRLLRLRSGTRAMDVAFKASPGARRPPERLPVERVGDATRGAPARPRPNGEEFINTPDTATSVP